MCETRTGHSRQRLARCHSPRHASKPASCRAVLVSQELAIGLAQLNPCHPRQVAMTLLP